MQSLIWALPMLFVCKNSFIWQEDIVILCIRQSILFYIDSMESWKRRKKQECPSGRRLRGGHCNACRERV